ncbi:MAG: transglutaminase-like domain-containing protein [Vulcanimicrobiaceae bacterium]
MLLQENDAAIKLRLGCRFSFSSPGPAPSIFLVRPHSTDSRRIREEHWESEPFGSYRDYRDVYGNVCRRATLPAGRSVVRYDVVAETSREADPVDLAATEHRAAELPDDVLLYTLPSRYCLSDVLAREALARFGGIEPGWRRVQSICDWVHEQIEFSYGTSNVTTTATDVLANGRGVCRDFTHLAMTFCRALSIPARYVCGYIPDIDVPPPDAPMDFCAWFEAYLGGDWWTFDPRNNQRRKGRVAIARGRDAADVAMVTTYGSTLLENMEVWADEIR